MTNQELYNKVRKHLLTQMAKSTFPSIQASCAYRGDNGLKCAIGCLIPDEHYSSSLEGYTARNEEVMRAAGLSIENINLAIDLQKIHDCHRVEKWATKLDYVASDYSLEIQDETS